MISLTTILIGCLCVFVSTIHPKEVAEAQPQRMWYKLIGFALIGLGAVKW